MATPTASSAHLFPPPRRFLQKLRVPSCPCSLRSSLILLDSFSVWAYLFCRVLWLNSKEITWDGDVFLVLPTFFWKAMLGKEWLLKL